MKQFFVIVIIGILSAAGYCGEGFDYKWVNQIGGNITDNGMEVTVDPNGNVFAIGAFSGTLTVGTEQLESPDIFDSFIIKYDEDGDLLWAMNSSSNYINYGKGAATDNAGNCYIAGYFYESLTFGGLTLTSSGRKDIYLAKIAPDGDVLWLKRGGGSLEDASTTIAVNGEGEVFLTGYFEGTANFDTVVLVDSVRRVFVAKYDTGGNVVWVKKGRACPSSGSGPKIACDEIGNCYLTGDEHDSSGTDIYVAKYDRDGTVVWSKGIDSAGSNSFDYNHGVAVDSVGNVFLAGNSRGTLNFGSDTISCNSSDSWQEIFLAKYNANGKELWARSLCGGSYEFGKAIGVDRQDNVFVTGYFRNTVNIGGIEISSNGSEDIFLFKYDNDGRLLWAAGDGGGDNDRGGSILSDGCGNTAIMGGFRDEVNFGGTTLMSTGSFDVFVAKIGNTYVGDFDGDCCVSVEDMVYFSGAWLSESGEEGCDGRVDMSGNSADVIDLLDFSCFAEHWLEGDIED